MFKISNEMNVSYTLLALPLKKAIQFLKSQVPNYF